MMHQDWCPGHRQGGGGERRREGPNRQIKSPTEGKTEEIQRNRKTWRHGQDHDILLAASGLKNTCYINKLSTICCLQAKPCNITWISYSHFFYSRLSFHMTSLALSTCIIHLAFLGTQYIITLEIRPFLKCPAFETVLNKERSLSSWFSLMRTEHQESEFFSLRSSGILSHTALSSFFIFLYWLLY